MNQIDVRQGHSRPVASPMRTLWVTLALIVIFHPIPLTASAALLDATPAEHGADDEAETALAASASRKLRFDDGPESTVSAQTSDGTGTSAVAAAFRPDTATSTSGLPVAEGGRGKQPVSVSGKFTSGLNEAFQLTLGGLFSDGANFQNTATIDVKNLLSDGGTLRFSGIMHLDTGGSGRDWIGAVNYIQPLLTWESGKLVGTVGFHVWQFPSVLNGKTDTVVDSGLTWVQSGPLSFTADANVKTLATGPGRIGVGGQIYYFRGTTSHPLIRKPKLSLALVHGPSYTYSNRFYGVHGHRVIRYEAGAVLQYGNWGIDAIYRPQLALQRGIPENRFWGFNIFYVFD